MKWYACYCKKDEISSMGFLFVGKKERREVNV